MADLSGFDRLWLGLLRAPVSVWARPHVLPEDVRARYAQPERPICYVLNEYGAADIVVLERVCAAHGLPSPSQALKKPLPSQSVLFLERRAGFWGDRTDYRISNEMRTLVDAAIEDPTLDVDLVPVTVLWGRAPDRKHSWLRILLSENWERAGTTARRTARTGCGRSP